MMFIFNSRTIREFRGNIRARNLKSLKEYKKEVLKRNKDPRRKLPIFELAESIRLDEPGFKFTYNDTYESRIYVDGIKRKTDDVLIIIV